LQPDGKILAGGDFNRYNGTTVANITRLNANGSIDAGFSAGAGFDGQVSAIVRQTDGKFIAGGSFTSYNGTTNNAIIRLNTDGSRDASFATGSGFGSGKGSGQISALALQTDGKVLVAGYFSNYNGTAAEYLVRLNSNGTLDNTFT